MAGALTALLLPGSIRSDRGNGGAVLAKVLTCAVVGLDGALVEADIGVGLPAFTVVGLPDAAVHEACSRIWAVVRHLEMAVC